MTHPLLSESASFTWGFGDKFFVEAPSGNYVWSDPDYDGDNTIRPFAGTYEQWRLSEGIPFGRDKGYHVVGHYCGPDVKVESW